MRTIGEVKADIKRYNNGDTILSYKKLLRELVCTLVDGIPLDRLEEICEAERDGRCVVTPYKSLCPDMQVKDEESLRKAYIPNALRKEQGK